MSEFSRLLKTSRLSALPKSKGRSRGRHYPTHQVVETRSAALDRNEWGLKYPIPSKVKSRYLSFTKLDSMEHMVDFEQNASFHLKRTRFQETGLVPEYETPRDNPLFFDNSKSTRRFVSIASLCNLNTNSEQPEISKATKQMRALRPQFIEWLLEKDPVLLKNKPFNRIDLAGAAMEFLTEINAKKPVDSVARVSNHYKSSARFQATGGLTYNLKGRLTNTPNGVAQKFVGPGRILNSSASARTVAYGGFTAELPLSSSNLQYNKAQSDGKSSREVVIPFTAEKAIFEDGGQVKIKTNVVVRQPSAGDDSKFFKSQERNFMERRASLAPGKNPADAVEGLLELIKRNERRR